MPNMPASLLTVPPKLIHKSFAQLDYASLAALELTFKSLCSTAKSFKNKLPPIRGNANKNYTQRDLVEIEKWPIYDGARTAEPHMQQACQGRDSFACSLCLKIRSPAHFSNAMMRGKKGKHDSATQKLARFCIDCGISSYRYQPGVSFQYGGGYVMSMYGVVCKKCGLFSEEDPLAGGCRSSRRCKSCYDV